jgi:NADH:ubiquinone reductase (H+-translocating)
VILLEGSPRILAAFVAKLSERAREQLTRLGVEVRTGSKVTAIDSDGVSFEVRAEGAAATIERLSARTVIWAAGVAGSRLGAERARGSGATLDRAGGSSSGPT